VVRHVVVCVSMLVSSGWILGESAKSLTRTAHLCLSAHLLCPTLEQLPMYQTLLAVPVNLSVPLHPWLLRYGLVFAPSDDTRIGPRYNVSSSFQRGPQRTSN
jgi:hypothetical protein